MGFWATWSSWRCPWSPEGGLGSVRWPLKVPSNPKHSMILWFIFQTSSSIRLRLYLLDLLDCSTRFTFMDNLCDGVHGQVHPLVTRPSINCISSLMAWGVMGSLSYKEFTLMLLVQIHLSHFSLSSLIHLVVVLMILSRPTLRDVGIHVTHSYNQLLHLGSNILPQWGSSDEFAAVLSVALFLFL